MESGVHVRYLIRRSTKDVWVWAEGLAKRKDVEEVWAVSPEDALSKEPLPDPRKVSMAELGVMRKVDLIVFAKVRMGLDLDQGLTKEGLLDHIKAEIFSRPADEQEAAPLVTRSFRDTADMRGKPGDSATVAGTLSEGVKTNSTVRA